jgi:beta-ureidopropionase / N-carbamoyl-L-amino-acid hydrolase
VTRSNLASTRVNPDRLWSRLQNLARIGAGPNGGCNRQALTDADFAARRLFVEWSRAAGCSVRVDAVGNLFVRRAGRDDTRPSLLTGSHLDTQPTGGKFDGVYGVLAGLEVLESLNEHGIRTSHPIEVAVWCNEEGCRFPAAMMGSAVWSSRMPLQAAYLLADPDGVSVRDELRRGGVHAEGPVSRQAVKAAFEAHIEQGPILERQGKTIGIVTGVQNMSRHEVVVEGQEAHAGPTPMDQRRDPIRVLAEVLPALYRAAEAHGLDARVTVGVIETLPGSPNTIPGRLRFLVDLRHPDDHQFYSLRQEVSEQVAAALARHSLKGRMQCIWEAPAVRFDPRCIEALRRAAAELGYPAMEMVSGAGHDSVNLAYVVPTAMLFVPCAGGLSHNEAESARQADLEAGANVLLHAMLACDSAE